MACDNSFQDFWIIHSTASVAFQRFLGTLHISLSLYSILLLFLQYYEIHALLSLVKLYYIASYSLLFFIILLSYVASFHESLTFEVELLRWHLQSLPRTTLRRQRGSRAAQCATKSGRIAAPNCGGPENGAADAHQDDKEGAGQGGSGSGRVNDSDRWFFRWLLLL